MTNIPFKMTSGKAAVAAVLLAGAVLCSCGSGKAEPACSPLEGTASAQSDGCVDYDAHFTHERLRIDLVLAGNSKEQNAFLAGLNREPRWGGSPSSLIDKFGYGQYFYELFSGEQLIFSRGFSTLFEEWRTTPEASRVSMAANQSVCVPFPKDSVRFVLYRRVRETGRFETMLEFCIDPADRHIVPAASGCSISLLSEYGAAVSGTPRADGRSSHVRDLVGEGAAPDYGSSHKVDIAVIAEGYTALQMDKFRADAARLLGYFFEFEPYSRRRSDFNIWLVESPSGEEGVDIPQEGIWKQTALDSMFDTFYEDRYLTVWNHTKIAAAAASVPYDALVVIANESKYGGGGIYNSYALGSSDNLRSLPVLVHEFGHSFAGLGDEYYESSSPYEDFYPAGVEPWEPNVTNLVDFGRKWADMMAEGTRVPTTVNSEGVACETAEDGAPVPTDPEKWTGVIGVFEGAGYMTNGCYRPYYECRMFNNTAPGFCPVCQRAIDAMIDFYVGRP